MRLAALAMAVAVSLATMAAFGQAGGGGTPGPYKVINKVAAGGAGGMDYCFVDSVGRKFYVPRGNRVEVFDVDTLKSAGTITPAMGVHGAAVDPVSKHGFCSSNPVVMWDTDTLKTIKTIPVEGGPDAILFDAFSQRVLILSHRAPSATVIDTKDGTILGTIDLGGAPEQGCSDGQGHVYISIEDKSNVAVVDIKAMKVTAHYDTLPKTGILAGLQMDVKNRLLFVSGRTPATCSVMNADTGAIIETLPIGAGVDASAFNPNTNELFVSTGDGKLTIIKETDPKTFSVEQTVMTMQGGKTCALDTKTGQVYVIASDRTAVPATSPAAAPAPAASAPAAGAPPARGGRGGGGAPGVFTILVVGKSN